MFFLFLKVFAEFYRVASKNLKKDFYEALDHHTTRLIDLFKSKKGGVGQSLDRFLQPINTQVSVSISSSLPPYGGVLASFN